MDKFTKNKLKTTKILYIDDDDGIRNNALEYLSFYSDYVYESRDGLEGLEVYKKINPDIIISDIKMPKLDGLSMIKEIRKTDKSTKMIIATAFTKTEYLLEAVELGLIKYLVKPITQNKLIDIVVKCLEDDRNIIKLNTKYTFDIFNKTLFKKDTLIELTKNETKCLDTLVNNRNRAVTYEEFNNYIWYGEMSNDAIKCLIRDLRKKTSKDLIKNMSGIGYKINI